MTSFTVCSHNIQGRFHLFAEELNNFVQKNSLSVVCLQDIGYLGPEGPNEWRLQANTARFYTNYSSTNKSRSVAIIVSEAWDEPIVERDVQGGLLGVTLRHDNVEVKVICAYLPPGLDRYGKPDRLSCKTTIEATRQREASNTYETISRWIRNSQNWILMGDLNETRDEKLDRKWNGERKHEYCLAKRKFVENFLQDSDGIDLWRKMYPDLANGHTRTDPRTGSTSRLDYAILRPSLLKVKEQCA